MVTFDQIYRFLDERFPRSLSSDWDNDGIMLAPASPEVKRVLISLDVTASAAEYAEENGFNLIISHHPLIFKPLKSVQSPKLLSLIRGGIGVMSFHTRLDAGSGGVNDTLASLLELDSVTGFGPTGEAPAGRIGILPAPMTVAEFTDELTGLLGCTAIEAAVCGTRIERLAILGGDGKDYYEAALATGADAYLTGSMSYNSLLDASEGGMSVFAAGHYQTEQPVCDSLAELLNDAFCLDIEVFECNPILTY